jgi:hypothetical protein
MVLGSLAGSMEQRKNGSRTGAKARLASGPRTRLPFCWEPVHSRVHLIPDPDCWIDGLDDAARRGDVFFVFDPESMTTCLGDLSD